MEAYMDNVVGNLYEGNVSFDNGKWNVLLTIDEAKLLFQKKL